MRGWAASCAVVACWLGCGSSSACEQRDEDEDEPALIGPLEMPSASAAESASTEVWLLRDRLRGRLPAAHLRTLERGADARSDPRVSWPAEHHFDAACGTIVLRATDALARAPEDLLAAVRARETAEDRVVVVEAMPDAPPPLRVVRALRHEDVERPSWYHGALLAVALADGGLVELSLDCESRSAGVHTWDALTRALVRSLGPGRSSVAFGQGRRELDLGSAHVTVEVPEGWAIAADHDDDGVTFELVRTSVYGAPSSVLSISLEPGCTGAAQHGPAVEGPTRELPGRVAGRPVRWVAATDGLRRVHREALFPRPSPPIGDPRTPPHEASCLEWRLEAASETELAEALRMAETARVDVGR